MYKKNNVTRSGAHKQAEVLKYERENSFGIWKTLYSSLLKQKFNIFSKVKWDSIKSFSPYVEALLL